MGMAMRNRITLVMVLAAALMDTATIAQSSTASPTTLVTPQGMRLDLKKSFHTHSPWHLIVTERASVTDYGGNDAPGALTLCLKKGPADPCLSGPVTPKLWATTPDDPTAWAPHYLLDTKVVYPRGPSAAPLLFLVTGSLYAGDGDQIVYVQLLRYDPESDDFLRVYSKSIGSNNNQEIRFITDGPLRGSVISAEPQEHAPYGYWIVVNTLPNAGAYRQVLRYLSATRYNDGNSLAVIDSEMPNIEKRLGLWKTGDPLPTPSAGDGKPCNKPMLKHSELWCE